jgi:two-component system, cell cycle sensor histidine kinase and response regulator CckA
LTQRRNINLSKRAEGFYHDGLKEGSQTVRELTNIIPGQARKELEETGEEALVESEEKFRSLSENAPDIIYTLKFDGSFTYVNPALKTILGYEPEEVLGKYFVEFVKEEEAREYVHILKDLIDKRETFKDIEAKIIHKDRSTRLFSASGAPNINMSGEVTGMVGLLKDITEQRTLEAQFQQLQRMGAIGTLSGGIAHDVNNLLMGIQGRTSLMLTDTGPSHPHFEHLKGIEDYIKSAADLTKQLLNFARGEKYEVKPIDINELIKTGSRMFGRTKKEIHIHGKYQKDVCVIEADRSQIEQVLMNLYVNAWQAMPSGGDLYLQTENVHLDENYVRPFAIAPGKYVKISVMDTGVGMDEATRQRVFDPFFTTNRMGGGTGLGLASAYDIIKNHGGFINVCSERGEGATFNIYLPASEKEVIDEKEFSKDLLRGFETVLFVDDEEMIVEIGEQFLEKLGYEVFVARGGKEATEIFHANMDRIDIVILDIIMPDMSGFDTFDRLRELKPDIKVIFSSGYSINGKAREIMDKGCDGFIQKPFNMKQLSQKLREILDKKLV